MKSKIQQKSNRNKKYGDTQKGYRLIMDGDSRVQGKEKERDEQGGEKFKKI